MDEKMLSDLKDVRINMTSEMKDLVVNADKVRNEIKRNLFNYIEYKGSNKTGGYYLK